MRRRSAALTAAGYLTPPKAILDILDADPLPTAIVSPASDVIALTSRHAMASIAEVSQPMLRLADVRINPCTNGPHRTQAGTGLGTGRAGRHGGRA